MRSSNYLSKNFLSDDPSVHVKTKNMAQVKNGMIVFLRDQIIPGPVMFDIEITNAFPLIALTKETQLIYPNSEREILLGYDHLSIPPDFRLHISGPKGYIFFNINPVLNLLEKVGDNPIHYFTVIGLPVKYARDLVPHGKTKTWNSSMIICPFKDGAYNDSTRIFVDFFLHSKEISRDIFGAIPPVMNEMRFVGDKHGYIIDQFSFESLQRKRKNDHDLLFTMRFGYINMDCNETTYIYTPLDIFQRRIKE